MAGGRRNNDDFDFDDGMRSNRNTGGLGGGSGAAANSSPGKVKKPVQDKIVFNASKREIHHPSSGFKKFFRRLRSQYTVTTNKEDIMRSEDIDDASLIIFGGPRQKFHTGEFERIKKFIDSGKSVLYMAGEGGEGADGDEQRTNFNYLGKSTMYVTLFQNSDN